MIEMEKCSARFRTLRCSPVTTGDLLYSQISTIGWMHRLLFFICLFACLLLMFVNLCNKRFGRASLVIQMSKNVFSYWSTRRLRLITFIFHQVCWRLFIDGRLMAENLRFLREMKKTVGAWIKVQLTHLTVRFAFGWWFPASLVLQPLIISSNLSTVKLTLCVRF